VFVKKIKGWQSWILALASAAVLLGTIGCAHTDETLNERPWNSPKNWETGMPTGMMQGR
jgi:hypothetical protein